MNEKAKLEELRALKILIVDSNVFIAKTLYSILEAFDVRKIIICHSLKEAEETYFNSEVDCIFVDFILEKRAGIKFIRKIRTSASKKNEPKLPIILETGMTDIDTITMARDAGVTEVISKPFSPDQVLQKLENAVFNPREFIDVDEYVGPNRRRRKLDDHDWEGENDRRRSATNNENE